MKYKSERSRACDIPDKVKEIVWERDRRHCIVCGSRYAKPNAHFISRAQGGLGIPENVVTMCRAHHHVYDQTTERFSFREFIREYLNRFYPDFTDEQRTFKRGNS